MTEESLTNEDKEILRRRLELLQREYERTAQRLQRAERKEAVRKHVQSRILHQNRLLQSNTPDVAQPSPASSSASNSGLPPDQTLPLETKPDRFLSAKKAPLVRFHLPEGSDSSPCSTPVCRRSPSQRLRSKRSRLRLQCRERESDTDSQEKARGGLEERLREEETEDHDGASKEKDMAGVTEKERNGTARGQEEEQNGWVETESDEERQRKELIDRLGKSARMIIAPRSAAEKSSVNISPRGVCPPSQVSPVGQPVDVSSQSSSAASDQLYMQVASLEVAGLSNQSDDPNEGAASGTKKGCEDTPTVPVSSEKAGFLDSCTVIEGLPFPVEYYVRTTRRMAAAHSQVDLDAVIHSQLSRGRGRRRSSPLQRQAGGHGTPKASQPGGRAPYQPRRRGRGRRGRRGHRRTQSADTTASSPAVPCTGSCSEQRESESASQGEPVPTPEPVPNVQPVSAVFKHLSDSQLYLDCKLLPDSEVYPLFRRRRGQAEGVGSCSQVKASTNGCTSPLPSLASLAQALKMKNFRHLGRLLSKLDVQDFHLPDDEFGQLKLERLRTSCSNVEPLIPHYSAYNTRNSSSCRNFRTNGDQDSSEGQQVIAEQFIPELLPLEGSFPLSQMSSADGSVRKGNGEEAEKHTASQKTCNTSSGLGMNPETEDPIQLSNNHQLEESTTYKDHFIAGLPKLQPLATEDIDKLTNCTKELGGEVQMNAGGPQVFLQTSPNTCRHNDAHAPLDGGSQHQTVLNLSMSLTSHTQHGPDPSLPSLGITPRLLTPTSPSVLPSILSSPSDKSIALCSSQPVAPAVETVCQATSRNEISTDAEREIQTSSGLAHGETTEPANEVWVRPLQNISGLVDTMPKAISENHRETKEFETQHEDIEQSENERHGISEHEVHQTESPPHSQYVDVDTGNMMNLCTTNETSVLPANQRVDAVNVFAADVPDQTNTPSEQTSVGLASPRRLVAQAIDAETLHQSQPIEVTRHSDQAISCGTLQKTHTLKALEGGCVLDVCLIRWPSGNWGVCVAGEWSVSLWAQQVGVQQWSLLHTWTFTQSVISLQDVPDSPGLLCVCLGRLEITEARILCCPSAAGDFSQAELCKGSVQAVVTVSDCRLACCSSESGTPQKVTVFTLTQDGSVAEALSLIPTNQSIQALAGVERKTDALIGWTECKTLLIWNMKSGQLLQTIRLAETMSMATCLKGYSYKGALCVLLQSASACDEKNGSALFTLIAINPLSGRNLTLTSIASPAPHVERLIDGDVCESMLVGVFQSGRLTVWDLRGGVASALGNGDAHSCRLARWAGPNTLLTGYLNGDVKIYQYKPTDTKAAFHH